MQDSMLDGRFKTFQHDHHLRELPGGAGTELADDLYFSLPFGVLGRMVGRYIMVPHIRHLMRSRFARIKRYAESDEWRRYLPESAAASDDIREVAQ
jgi:ligand-binding SRPBCC domain-containing protein